MLLPRLILTSSIEVYPATNDKFKKKFCYHKILANFHIKSSPPSSPPLSIVLGGGAETMYNQYYPCTWLSFIRKIKKKRKKEMEVC